MNLIELLNDKSLKGTEKREEVIRAIVECSITLNEIDSLCNSLNDKQITDILEAIEEITK